MGSARGAVARRRSRAGAGARGQADGPLRKPTPDAPPDLRAPGTPEDVRVTLDPPAPYTDPTLGVAVARPAPRATPRNRLVALGDSLTHGFQSGAIFNTQISYPALIANELGWRGFRYPTYSGPGGGIPLNIEALVRDLEKEFGDRLSWWEVGLAVFRARHWMDGVEDWWERGGGAQEPNVASINHNLAVYGWDLRDTLDLTAARCRAVLGTPKDQFLRQVVEHANERAAIRVLHSSEGGDDLTPLAAAARLGEQVSDDPAQGDPEHGIETLIVFLGANNALQAVTDLKVNWSADGYDDVARKGAYTVWRPTHFQAELAEVADAVRGVRARHVIWGTVPHVTIVPVARGIGGKLRPGSRYFPYYTRPWIADPDFDPRDDPYITGAEARAVDSAIDQYNDAIAQTVAAARRDGLDWYLLDCAGLLDRLAQRRYLEDPNARPAWWSPYPLPPELGALDPPPDSRFFQADGGRRSQGGLFSLDGIHPTTVGYGILAQEFMNVMVQAGVAFQTADGTPRPPPVRIDFRRLLPLDTLVADPPSVDSELRLIGWVDRQFDALRRLFGVRTPAGG